MGSKCNVRRLKRVYRCDECPKTFRSFRALSFHKKTFVHNDEKKIKRIAKLAAKSEKPQPESESTSESKRSSSPSPAAGKKLLENANRKIDFACPICDKAFNVYFSAFRHVQKYHCQDIKGKTVNPNSPNLIKPLRREQCVSCSKTVKSSEFHTCFQTQEDLGIPAEKYLCIGCGQDFSSIKIYDVHLGGVHHEYVHSMYFPTRKDFIDWKEKTEKQTKTTYSLMSRYTAKEFYRCSHLQINDDVTHFCPSSIVLKDFSKGIQIHFYPVHFGHKSIAYCMAQEDKKYCITSMLKKAEGYQDLDSIQFETNDIYAEFKNLMEHIVLEAAKLDIKSLKRVMGQALRMSQTLKEYDEDEDTFQEVPGYKFNQNAKEIVENSHQKMTDNQISSALMEVTTKTPDPVRVSNRLRRKSSVNSRPDFIQEPMVKKSRGSPLAENVSTPKRFKSNEEFETVESKPDLEPHEPLAQLRIVDTFSLNASVLKQNNNQIIVNNEKDPLSSTENDKKENVTTVIESPIAAPNDIKQNINNTVKEQPKVRFSLSQSQSFNDSYKEFVDKNFKYDNCKPARPKKNVMKTRIGQFIPNSPRRKSLASPPALPAASPASPKIDVQINNGRTTPDNKSDTIPSIPTFSISIKSEKQHVNNSDVKHTTLGKDDIKPVKGVPKTYSRSDKKLLNKSDPKPTKEPTLKNILKTPKRESKSTPKSEPKSMPNGESKSTTKSEPKSVAKSESKSVAKSESKSMSKSESKSTPKSESKSTPKSESKSTPKSESKSMPKSEPVKAKGDSKPPSKSVKKPLETTPKQTIRSKPLINKKIDIKYEVKEQENDCNILVLKI